MVVDTRTKSIIRALVAAFSVIALGTFVKGVDFDYQGLGDPFNQGTIAICTIVCLWSIGSIWTSKWIHLGVQLSLDLILALLFFVFGGIQCSMASSYAEGWGCNDPYAAVTEIPKRCREFSSLKASFITACVFLIIIALGQTMTFILDWVALAEQRQHRVEEAASTELRIRESDREAVREELITKMVAEEIARRDRAEPPPVYATSGI